MTTAELPAKMPGFDWNAYLGAAGLGGVDGVIVAQPSALTGAAKLVGSEPIETWKDYLTFRTIAASAPFLTKAFVDENFAFNGKVLSGTPQLPERWKRASGLVGGGMGEAVGQLYVARYFPPEAKAKADELVRNLIKAMDLRLQGLTWMAPETKAKARVKLAAFTPKIGYPDKWRDYSALEIRQGDALGNALARRPVRISPQHRQDRPAHRPLRMGHVAADGERLRQPADEREWCSRPRSCSRLSSIPRPTTRSITAASAPSSAMRSATISTIRAASSTPRAISPTGGPRRTSPSSRS